MSSRSTFDSEGADRRHDTDRLEIVFQAFEHHDIRLGCGHARKGAVPHVPRDLAKRVGSGWPAMTTVLFAFCIVGPRLHRCANHWVIQSPR